MSGAGGPAGLPGAAGGHGLPRRSEPGTDGNLRVRVRVPVQPANGEVGRRSPHAAPGIDTRGADAIHCEPLRRASARHRGKKSRGAVHLEPAADERTRVPNTSAHIDNGNQPSYSTPVMQR